MKKNRSIGMKVTVLVLMVSLVSMAFFSVVAFTGILSMRQTARWSSFELGRLSAEDSSAALTDQAKLQVHTLVEGIAQLDNERLAGIQAQVRMLANVAADTYQHPEKYPDRPVYLPAEQNNGAQTAQLIFSSDYRETPAALEEIGRLAHLQDFLVQFSEANDAIGGAYIGTEHGFTIIADRLSGTRATTDYYYEAQTRPWYAQAVARGELSWTDVMADGSGRGLGIVCSCPVYAPDGALVAVVGIGSILEDLQKQINTRVGETGHLFLINENGGILISPKTSGDFALQTPDGSGHNLLTSANTALAEAGSCMVAGESGVTALTVDDEPVFLAYHPIETMGWSIGAVISEQEILAPALATQQKITQEAEAATERINSAIRQVTLAILALLAAIVAGVILISIRFSHKLTGPIETLMTGVDEISGGNLDYQLCVTTGDELEQLAGAFNRMTGELRSYMEHLTAVTADKQRIETELNVATRIQTSMLPCIFPAFPERSEFDIFASMNPAKEVGGDFYDFFMIGEEHLAVVVADVSGKGVPAALFMVIARTLIKNHAQSGMAPSVVFETVNTQLCENNDENMFVTAFLGVYELATGKFSYVNAGHNPPLLARSGEPYGWLDGKSGMILAGMEDLCYRQYEIALTAGDRLFLYTDGVTEAMNPDGTLYSDPRLLALFNSGALTDQPVADCLRIVQEDVALFADGAEQADDITMLFLEIH